MEHVNSAPDVSRGIFTSIAVRNACPVFLRPHLQRLAHSCSELYGKTLPASLETDVSRLASTLGDAERVRVEVRPSDTDLEVRFATGPRPGDAEPFELDVITRDQWNGAHKWIDRSMLPASDVLIVDGRGQVLEAGVANVFAVLDGEMVTPPLDGRVLPGIARGWLVGTRTVRESPLLLDELLRADEVFVTNALRGVVPVVRCGETVWNVGEMTIRLMEAWRRG